MTQEESNNPAADEPGPDQADGSREAVRETGRPATGKPGMLTRLLGWSKAHKIATLFLAVLAFFLYEVATLPWFSIGSLKLENPKQTALMRQRMEEAEGEGKRLTIVQSWIPLGRLPRYVIDAVVVAEDGTFWTHDGFDWYEVKQSVEKNIEKRRAARGASTITQQLAKNLYLSTSKDPLRKAKEAVITVLLERRLDKNRILELYLNCIEWGRGIFGIDAAARTYFGKSASALTLDEAARLAAVIPSPLRHRPDAESKYVLFRTRIVLNRMAARNELPQSQTEEVSSSQTEPEPAELEDTDSTATDEGSNNGL